MCIIKDFKPVDPFSLQKCMERFYTGVIPWICFLWITANHIFGCFLKWFRYVLASSVAVEDQRFYNISETFCFFNTFHYVGCLQRLTQHPGNDFYWIQIHHTGKIHNSFKCPNISDIWTPDSIWMSGIEFLVEDIFEFLAEIRIYGCLDIWFHPMGFDSHLTPLRGMPPASHSTPRKWFFSNTDPSHWEDKQILQMSKYKWYLNTRQHLDEWDWILRWGYFWVSGWNQSLWLSGYMVSPKGLWFPFDAYSLHLFFRKHIPRIFAILQ